LVDQLEQDWLKAAYRERARGDRHTADVPCPLCASQSTHPRKRVLRIWDKGDRFTFFCGRCEARGPGRNESPRPDRTPEQQVEDERKRARAEADEERKRQTSVAAARAIWDASFPVAGTAAADWLASRGIDVARVPGDLRYHPDCPYEGNEPSLPSFIARYTDAPTGEPLGVRRRPILAGAKAMTRGPQRGAVVRLWPEIGDALCLAEGIETALFAATSATLHGKVLQPMWAAGNAVNMKNFPVLPGVKTLMLLADNDTSNTGQDAAKACADRWVAAGRTVKIVTPRRPDGRATFDFNDFHTGSVTERIEIGDLVDIEVFAPAQIEPTYPLNDQHTVANARLRLQSRIGELLGTASVSAIRVATGVGKTETAARVIAELIRARNLRAPVLYAVPTHKLGENIAIQFRQHGLTAAVWRGREAFAEDGSPLCDDLPAVKLAQKAGAPIEESCCRGETPTGTSAECALYNSCLYQKQKKKQPDVWLVSHEMLFIAQETIKKPSAVLIDESFWQAGVFGMPKRDKDRDISPRGITIDEIARVPLKKLDVANDLAPLREALARACSKAGLGGIPRQLLIDEGLTSEKCTEAIKLEWQFKEEPAIWPGMPAEQREKAPAGNVSHIRAIDRVWRIARDLIEREEGTVSGRLYIAELKTDEGVARVVRARGIRSIIDKYTNKPTIIMDATMPDITIIQKFFPTAEVAEAIDVEMPYVHARQVLGAPITKWKLLGGAGRSLAGIIRYILKRWVETGRGPTLVIAQKGIREALSGRLPDTIRLEHFNAIAGLDGYKDVRLLITIGRTEPKPLAVEDFAGALAGTEPARAKAAQPNGITWYDRVQRGITRKDGSAVAVECSAHADPLAEAVRWQVCEAELIQAIGRGRGVNRTPETPLDIDVLADVVLPVAVDEVREWKPPGLDTIMSAEGVVLHSPTDIAKAWPDVWGDREAARNWLFEEQRLIFLYRNLYKGESDGVHRVRYKSAGPKQKWKPAWFDLAVVPDPRAWLESRLGPLADYRLIGRNLVGHAPTITIEPEPAGIPFDGRRRDIPITPAGFVCAPIELGLAAAARCPDHTIARWRAARASLVGRAA
jgi:hypothetical protein